MKNTSHEKEKAILIGVKSYGQELPLDEYLDELEQLVYSSGGTTLKRFTQNLDHPNPKTYVGSGKIDQISEYCNAEKIDMAVFDDELSPAQIKNLENRLPGTKVISRTHLILDIFANNARTAQAKLQVELAQSIFMLPRLTGLWTHLSKQKGGIGMKGPGETEIETDRRALRNKISLLKKKLVHVEKIGNTQRAGRQGEMRAALVGYTNVGKSTIMNLLARSEVLVENKLFATLDSTVRKVVLPHPNELKPPVLILLSDTVGFIRKLPTLLVESFKSTLAEALEADILIHVVDISNPRFESQMLSVKETLHEIGASDKPEVVVFNKIDAYKSEDAFFVGESEMTLEQFEKSWIAKENSPAVFVSARDKNNIETLRSIILEELFKSRGKKID